MPFRVVKNLFVALFLVASLALGADAALEQQETIELEPGTPLFQLMSRRGGIADTMDKVARKKVTIVGWDQFQEAREGFDPRVFRKLLPMFKGSTTAAREKNLKKLIDALEGEKLNVTNAVAAIANVMSEEGILKDPSRIGLEATRIAPLVMLASGGGTGVTLDENNHTYHYGYKAGENGDFANEPSDVNRKRKIGRAHV